MSAAPISDAEYDALIRMCIGGKKRVEYVIASACTVGAALTGESVSKILREMADSFDRQNADGKLDRDTDAVHATFPRVAAKGDA